MTVRYFTVTRGVKVNMRYLTVTDGIKGPTLDDLLSIADPLFWEYYSELTPQVLDSFLKKVQHYESSSTKGPQKISQFLSQSGNSAL